LDRRFSPRALFKRLLKDPAFQTRFLERLRRIYKGVHGYADDECLETLLWLGEMLRTGRMTP
jgi:hypothetical protein